MPRQRHVEAKWLTCGCHISKRVPPANMASDVALPRRLTWDPPTYHVAPLRCFWNHTWQAVTGGSGIITAVYDEVAGYGSEVMISQSLSINVAIGMTK
ncbi:hypothetical protein Tco_0056549 [Tanacetum coccineum]